MATTVTQSRLLTLARYHPASHGRWPQQTRELFHHAVTPAIAISLYALRPGCGYCIAWIRRADDGVSYYRDEQHARTHLKRALQDLKAEETT